MLAEQIEFDTAVNPPTATVKKRFTLSENIGDAFDFFRLVQSVFTFIIGGPTTIGYSIPGTMCAVRVYNDLCDMISVDKSGTVYSKISYAAIQSATANSNDKVAPVTAASGITSAPLLTGVDRPPLRCNDAGKWKPGSNLEITEVVFRNASQESDAVLRVGFKVPSIDVTFDTNGQTLELVGPICNFPGMPGVFFFSGVVRYTLSTASSDDSDVTVQPYIKLTPYDAANNPMDAVLVWGSEQTIPSGQTRTINDTINIPYPDPIPEDEILAIINQMKIEIGFRNQSPTLTPPNASIVQGNAELTGVFTVENGQYPGQSYPFGLIAYSGVTPGTALYTNYVLNYCAKPNTDNARQFAAELHKPKMKEFTDYMTLAGSLNNLGHRNMFTFPAWTNWVSTARPLALNGIYPLGEEEDVSKSITGEAAGAKKFFKHLGNTLYRYGNEVTKDAAKEATKIAKNTINDLVGKHGPALGQQLIQTAGNLVKDAPVALALMAGGCAAGGMAAGDAMPVGHLKPTIMNNQRLMRFAENNPKLVELFKEIYTLGKMIKPVTRRLLACDSETDIPTLGMCADSVSDSEDPFAIHTLRNGETIFRSRSPTPKIFEHKVGDRVHTYGVFDNSHNDPTLQNIMENNHLLIDLIHHLSCSIQELKTTITKLSEAQLTMNTEIQAIRSELKQKKLTMQTVESPSAVVLKPPQAQNSSETNVLVVRAGENAPDYMITETAKLDPVNRKFISTIPPYSTVQVSFTSEEIDALRPHFGSRAESKMFSNWKFSIIFQKRPTLLNINGSNVQVLSTKFLALASCSNRFSDLVSVRVWDRFSREIAILKNDVRSNVIKKFDSVSEQEAFLLCLQLLQGLLKFSFFSNGSCSGKKKDSMVPMAPLVCDDGVYTLPYDGKSVIAPYIVEADNFDEKNQKFQTVVELAGDVYITPDPRLYELNQVRTSLVRGSQETHLSVTPKVSMWQLVGLDEKDGIPYVKITELVRGISGRSIELALRICAFLTSRNVRSPTLIWATGVIGKKDDPDYLRVMPPNISKAKITSYLQILNMEKQRLGNRLPKTKMYINTDLPLNDFNLAMAVAEWGSINRVTDLTTVYEDVQSSLVARGVHPKNLKNYDLVTTSNSICYVPRDGTTLPKNLSIFGKTSSRSNDIANVGQPTAVRYGETEFGMCASVARLPTVKDVKPMTIAFSYNKLLINLTMKDYELNDDVLTDFFLTFISYAYKSYLFAVENSLDSPLTLPRSLMSIAVVSTNNSKKTRAYLIGKNRDEVVINDEKNFEYFEANIAGTVQPVTYQVLAEIANKTKSRTVLIPEDPSGFNTWLMANISNPTIVEPKSFIPVNKLRQPVRVPPAETLPQATPTEIPIAPVQILQKKDNQQQQQEQDQDAQPQRRRRRGRGRGGAGGKAGSKHADKPASGKSQSRNQPKASAK